MRYSTASILRGLAPDCKLQKYTAEQLFSEILAYVTAVNTKQQYPTHAAIFARCVLALRTFKLSKTKSTDDTNILVVLNKVKKLVRGVYDKRTLYTVFYAQLSDAFIPVINAQRDAAVMKRQQDARTAFMANPASVEAFRTYCYFHDTKKHAVAKMHHILANSFEMPVVYVLPPNFDI